MTLPPEAKKVSGGIFHVLFALNSDTRSSQAGAFWKGPADFTWRTKRLD